MLVIVFFLVWWIVAWGLIRRYVYGEERAFAIIMSNLIGFLYGMVVAWFLYLVL